MHSYYTSQYETKLTQASSLEVKLLLLLTSERKIVNDTFREKFDKCFTSLWDEKNSAILVWCSYGLKREPAKVPAMRICFSALFLGFVSETRATLS